MGFANLLHRGIGDDEHHDVAEGDRLLDRAGLREWSDAGDEALQIIGMARREHHRMAGLDEQPAERTALASGTDHADLQRRARCLRHGDVRPSCEREPYQAARCHAHKIPARVISDGVACHDRLLG